MKQIKIYKRDGTQEYWNDDKILVSITKAGVDLEKAEIIVSDIEGWAKKTAKNNKISSTQLRDKIIESLEKTEPMAADQYASYKK